MRLRHLLVSSLLALFGALSPVHAQPQGGEAGGAASEEGGEEIVTLTPAQLEMNERAVEAVNRNDFATAIKLFQASIALGEANITYLNMARTYHRMGECTQAKRTYRRTRDVSAKVAAPTPSQINEALNTYESELYKDCDSGELTVVCEPGKMDLYLNDKGPVPCPSESDPLLLKEGDYVVRGEMEGYEAAEFLVKVGRVDPTKVALTLAKRVTAPTQPKPPPAEMVIIRDDKGDEKLEEINKRLEIEAQERADKDQRARDVEIARQRKLDEERVLSNRLRELEVDLERRNTRLKRGAWIAAGVLAVGGAMWDSCLGFGGWRAQINNQQPRPEAWCDHAYNGDFEPLDLAPIGLYTAAISTVIISSVIRKTRRKNFELDYKLAPSETLQMDD